MVSTMAHELWDSASRYVPVLLRCYWLLAAGAATAALLPSTPAAFRQASPWRRHMGQGASRTMIRPAEPFTTQAGCPAVSKPWQDLADPPSASPGQSNSESSVEYPGPASRSCRAHLLGLPFQDWTTPQSWFSHFYLVGLLVTASVGWVYQDKSAAQVRLSRPALRITCRASHVHWHMAFSRDKRDCRCRRLLQWLCHC